MDSDDESCSDNSDSELDVFPGDDYKLEEIIAVDDKGKLLSRINRYSYKYVAVPPEHWIWIFRYGAVKCAAALLEGEPGRTVDFDGTRILDFPMMFAVAGTCNGDLIELFIRHGAPLDHRCYGLAPIDASLEGKLPLNVAVESLASLIFFNGWNFSKPVFEMLVLLCMHIQKNVIKCISMLVLNTKEAELEICQYAREGKVVQLAALLMTAREKVAPILYQIGDGSTSNGGISIRQCIYSKLAALTYEESKLTSYNEKKLLRDCKEKKMEFVSTAELLNIFEMAGDTIEAYIRLQRDKMPEEQVAIDVSWLLQGTRLLPKYKGVNLSKIWSRPERRLGYIQATRYAIQAKELVKRKLMRKLSDREVNGNTKQKSIIAHTGFPHGSPSLPLRARSFHTMRVPLGSQSTTFMEAHVKKTTKPRNLYLTKNLSRQRWTSVAIAIKLGMRCL